MGHWDRQESLFVRHQVVVDADLVAFVPDFDELCA
jgi:hypothetical protein